MNSVITGVIKDPSGTVRPNVVLTFKPTKTLPGASGGVTLDSSTYGSTSDGAGAFSISLPKGGYLVRFDGIDPVNISVPGDGQTYTIVAVQKL